jgi:DNA repair exonuclease SbcCD nuclease subunit
MKIALLCDTHLGVKSDSKVYLKHQERFFSELFFPTLETHDVKTVLHLGDIFDRRKFINFFTLRTAKEIFFDVMRARGITMHAILGNHDTFFTTTNEVNSVSLLLPEYDNIHVYETEPVELSFGSTRVMMCPWLTSENFERAMTKMKTSTAHILCGHFDLKGFEMMRGILSEHGINHKDLSHFESVYSGHYHHPSSYDNVRYLGAQYEMNWSDYGGRRGFYLLDTETRDLTFIENTNRIHHKLDYDDADLTIDEIADLDTSILKDCYVKVIVRNRTNPYLYDLFLNRLNDCGAADVKTVEDHLNMGDVTVDDLVGEAKDTKDILHSYIDNVDTKIDKNRIKSVIDELYVEAMAL